MYARDEKRPSNSEDAIAQLQSLSDRTQNVALGYVIETIALTWLKGYSRIDAQREVAHRHGITISTVMDKFGYRRGGVTAEELDKILDTGNVADLERFLHKLFKNDNNTIRELVLTLKPHRRAPVLPRMFAHMSESQRKELAGLFAELIVQERTESEFAPLSREDDKQGNSVYKDE